MDTFSSVSSKLELVVPANTFVHSNGSFTLTAGTNEMLNLYLKEEGFNFVTITTLKHFNEVSNSKLRPMYSKEGRNYIGVIRGKRSIKMIPRTYQK